MNIITVKTLCSLAVAAFVCSKANAQSTYEPYTITTLGWPGAPGFYFPQGMAMDGSGNLFVAEHWNHMIRKITPAGMVSIFAGTGALGSADGDRTVAQFRYPRGVAVDDGGNVYVADTGNDTIRKIAPDGTVTTFAGFPGVSGSNDGAGPQARFHQPFSLTVDRTGNVYVADSWNSTIRKITADGIVSTFAGLAGSYGSADGEGGNARFGGPEGVAADDDGNVYVADTGNNTIRKITPGRSTSTLAGFPRATGSADGIGSAARFSYPEALVVDSRKTIFVSDRFNHTIRKITQPGLVTTTLAGYAEVSGWSDGQGSAARFHSPNGIVVSNTGELYVADTINQTIRLAMPFGPVSSKMHGSAAWDISLPLAGVPGIECRSSEGAAGAYQVIVNCARTVTFAGANVTSGSGKISDISGNNSATVVVDLVGVASGQTIALTITDLSDGSMTRDLVIPMGILPGDVDGNGAVNASDTARTRSDVGGQVNAFTFREDVSANGAINAGDLILIRSQAGAILPQ